MFRDHFKRLSSLKSQHFVLLFHRFTAEERAKRPQMCHMPFGFGPRNCIGMRFALLEAKIALIELLKRYTFVRTADTEVLSLLYTH